MSETRPNRSIAAAVTLFFTAPLVAEFLLGNLSLKLLPALVVLAPFYGGGALIIRESARRTHRGWPTVLILGAAYTLVEEAFNTQSLFNPDYLHLHLHLLDNAWIPALGIGAWWTLFMFNLHTFWSISVSIALTEALFPARRTTPWLGPIGTSFFALLFIAGFIATTSYNLKHDPFLASRAQFLSAGLLCLLLIALAFLVPKPRPHFRPGTVASPPVSRPPVPRPWLTGTVTLILGMAVLVLPPTWNWGAVAALLAIDILFLIFAGTLSQRSQWQPIHTFSLAAGGALAYGLHAFTANPVGSGSGLVVRIGNALFLAAAVVLIIAGAKRTSRNLSDAPVQSPLLNETPDSDRLFLPEKGPNH